MNNVGDQIIDELNAEIFQLRDLIGVGDVRGLSNLFQNVGSPGYRNLASTTSDPCLQRVSLSLAEVEAFVASLLQCTTDQIQAGDIVCNTLDYEAQQINSCRAASSCVVLA